MGMLIASSCRIRPLFLAVAFLLVFSLASSILFLLTVQREGSTILSDPFDYAFTSSAAPGWRPFNASRAPVLLVPGEHPAQPTLSQSFFTPQCADLWVSRGELCAALLQRSANSDGEALKLSVVHTWVNGSDTRLKHARQRANREVLSRITGRVGTIHGNANRHFRAHDELVYSLRSVMKALPAESIDGLHVVTTDLPVSSEDAGTRYGQVPEWLNRTHAQDGSCAPAVHMHHHWDLFKMRTHAGLSAAGNVTEEDEARAEAWRERVLPSFNSIGIETQLVSLAPQLSNTILYFNDDFFVTRPLDLTDFTSPLFGTVFRLQSSLLVASTAGAADKEGEWPSLHYANKLLDERFGVRQRPYVQHFVKTYEKEILAEIAQIWPEELTESAEVRFRDGPAVGLAFLATHFVVERHREALLWSFLVARADSDASRTYSPAERRAVLAELTPAAENAKYRKRPTVNGNALRPQILVPKPRRAPLYAPHDALARVGLPTPRATAYTFSAHASGYAYARLGGHTKWQNGEPVWVEPGRGQRWVPDRNWPVYDYDDSGDTKEEEEEGAADEEMDMDIECALDVVECFGEAWVAPADGDGDVPVEEVFKRVSFEHPRCGDCIIAGLVGQSGSRGLGAFLPPPPHSPADAEGTMQMHMPLSVEKTWKNATYADGLAGDGSRARAVSLLQRYSYIIGDSPAELITYTNSRHLNRRLGRLVAAIRKEEPAFVVLNDDTADRITDREVVLIDSTIKKLLQGLWPDQTCWEAAQ